MSAQSRRPDLHGSVPDRASLCLVIIDMINPLEFEGAAAMLPAAIAAAQRTSALKQRVKEAGLPVIYVNDNFGKWQSDFRRLVERCLERTCRGQRLAELLRPDEDDYFVLKPKHSGFYATPLELLLQVVGVRRLILTGIAGDNCVLQTAADAYMRDYALSVPADCTASVAAADNGAALRYMQRMFKADIRDSSALFLPERPSGTTARAR